VLILHSRKFLVCAAVALLVVFGTATLGLVAGAMDRSAQSRDQALQQAMEAARETHGTADRVLPPVPGI